MTSWRTPCHSRISRVGDDKVHLSAQSLLAEDVGLEFENFKPFFETRRSNLKERLMSRVFMSKSISEEPSTQEFDEEVVEEALI